MNFSIADIKLPKFTRCNKGEMVNSVEVTEGLLHCKNKSIIGGFRYGNGCEQSPVDPGKKPTDTGCFACLAEKCTYSLAKNNSCRRRQSS
jgi:hypothetical protein